MNKYLVRALLAASALSTFGYQIAFADEALPKDDKSETIVVTADKVAKPLQKTSIAVSVVSGQEITMQGRSKIDDVLSNQPATVVQGGSKGYLVSIRGLGLNLPAQMGQGAVSTNYDGAYSSRSENSNVGFYDLLRVEVLRGPQATLYGRNSVGGVVNVISKDPTLKQNEGYYTLEAGNYGLVHIEGAANAVINDNMAIRIAAAGINRDGYMSNGHDDNKSYGLRGKFLWKMNEDSSAIIGIENTNIGGKGPGAVPTDSIAAGNRNTSDVAYGEQDVTATKYWANYQTKIGPGELVVIPSYQVTNGKTLGAFGGNFSYSLDPKEMVQKALEIRYHSLPNSKIEWNIGLYHYDNHNTEGTIAGACEDTAGNFIIPSPGYNAAPPGPPGPSAAGTCLTEANWVKTNYSMKQRMSTTDAVFGQTIVPVTENLRAILGLRYSAEKVEGVEDRNNESTTVFVKDFYNLTPIEDNHVDYKLGFEQLWGGGNMVYGTIASGYRQGGYSTFGDIRSFDAEEMISYELGSKNRLLDGALTLNASAFYYDYSSYQLVIANFTTPTPQIYVPTMPATEYGAEFEFMARIGEAGRLTGSISLLKSELEGRDGFYVGAPFTNAPEYTVKASYSHDINFAGGTLTPRIDVRAVGDYLVYPDEKAITNPNNMQEAYVAGDISVLYMPSDGNWSANFYVKNVSDKFIKSSHFFGYAQLQAPRTYGAVFTKKF